MKYAKDRVRDHKESKSKLSINRRIGLATSTAAVIVASMSAPAQAHVSISPLIGVSTTGTIARDSVTIGKSGYLFFRLGHGCAYGATTDVNPLTGLSLEGTSWGTHAFSVTIPYAAAVNASTGALKAPKPGYRPGWVSKVVLNQGAIVDVPSDITTLVDDSYTITWTAKSADFDVPAYAQDDEGVDVQTVFAEFQASVSWASSTQNVQLPSGTGTNTVGTLASVATDATTGATQYFNAGQTCVATLSKKPALASAAKVTVTALTGGRASVKIDAASTQRNKTVTLSSDGVAVTTPSAVVLNSQGDATVTLTGDAATAVKATGALIAVKANGTLLGYKLGSASVSHTLQINWNQQLASGAVAVESDNGRTESNQAPSVKVYTAS